MLYAPLLRRRVAALWERLSPEGIDGLPLAKDIRFSYPGDHAMAIEATSADELRRWLHALFERFPGLTFEVHEVVVDGPPWSLHTATRYAAVQHGKTLYQGTQFTHIRWGKVVREHVLPDTQAVARLAPR
jgi:ketosteroid isomerase-like protein